MGDLTSHVKSAVHIAVDIGGTFTDGVAYIEDSHQIWVGKTLTTPDDPGRAVSDVMEDLLRQVRRERAHADAVLVNVVHGTTLVTNTLIERKGVPTLLVTTSGFKDVLDIGRESRYDLYDLELSRPAPLVDAENRVEVGARMDANGQVVQPLRAEDFERMFETIKRLGVGSVAITLLHSYANASHEQQLAQGLRARLPDISVTTSSELANEIKEYERTSTAVASAYVKPVVEKYLAQLQSRIDRLEKGIPLRVMVSSGGFTSARSAGQTPIHLLESGPAAGVLSAMNTASIHNVRNVLAFDMGGTTAKACVVTGLEAPVAFSFECARVHRFKRGSGLPILVPSIDLIEIGAGGGSIAHVNELGLLNVGPESASSVPGPVCYGLGGDQITVTDADLLLGYLNADNFLGGEMRLRKDLALEAIGRLASHLGLKPLEVAWGIHNIVNENMAGAARVHIAEKGFDPRDFVMVGTGGAGPVHAVDVARKLRIPRLLASIAAGAGSCLGMLAAPARVDRSWSQPVLLADADWTAVRLRYAGLKDEASAELAEAGQDQGSATWLVGTEMRYFGQGDNVTVTIPFDALGADPAAALLQGFEKEYSRLYGHVVPDARAQVLTWRLTGRSPRTAKAFNWGTRRGADAAERKARDIYLPLKHDFGSAKVYDRYALQPGTVVHGPLVLEERESTLVVPFEAEVEILADLTVSISLKEFE